MSEPIRVAVVKQSLGLNANTRDLMMSTCKKCIFNDIHDMCLLDFVKNMNGRSKSAKKLKKQNVLETYGITTTKIVPIKEEKESTPVLLKCSSKHVKIVKSKNANNSEPNHTWGSNATDIPSSYSLVNGRSSIFSSGTVRFENDQIVRIMGYGDYQLKNPIINQSKDTNQEKLYLLHMDLCDPMRVASINGKRYILVIVDDYSRFTWVRFLRTKDEAPEAIIKCIKNIQVCLNITVRNVRTNNGTEFVNQTLREFYENVGISHQTSVARTPQQNGVVERRNQTLVEAARTMLIFSKAPVFLWAEAINTACYTQNRSLIRIRYNKTPYELMHDKKPDLSFLHVFGSLCYPTNDNEDLGKLDAKADIGIFVGYAPTKKAFRIYNRRTWKIIETIHVTFDELTTLASEQFNSGPELHSMTPATSSSGLVLNPVSQQPCTPPKRDDWDRLFQPMSNEYFNPPTIVVSPVQEAAAPKAVDLADSLVSTSIDQDAPSQMYLHQAKMDDLNITVEEYIRLEEEKAHRRGKVYNWETATHAALSCKPMVSSLNKDEIDFRISLDESDDEDCTDLVKEISTNIGGEFSNLEDLEVLES
ncbi:retrovirus-related pol polyprotein from transposon TNT 1-94 [Tanacetum coccineum]